MTAMASQITGLKIAYSTVYSGADQRKHQSPALLAFVRGINRCPVNSPHKGPVTWKMFPFDDVIMVISLITSMQIAMLLYMYMIQYRANVLEFPLACDSYMIKWYSTEAMWQCWLYSSPWSYRLYDLNRLIREKISQLMSMTANCKPSVWWVMLLYHTCLHTWSQPSLVP